MVGQEKDDTEVMLMMGKPKKRVLQGGKEKPTPLSALKKKITEENGELNVQTLCK